MKDSVRCLDDPTMFVVACLECIKQGWRCLWSLYLSEYDFVITWTVINWMQQHRISSMRKLDHSEQISHLLPHPFHVRSTVKVYDNFILILFLRSMICGKNRFLIRMTSCPLVNNASLFIYTGCIISVTEDWNPSKRAACICAAEVTRKAVLNWRNWEHSKL